MAAISTDIAAAKREAIIVSISDSAIRDRFPNARDGQKAPATGYFDSPDDCAASLARRNALLGTVRRRFAVRVQDVIEPDLSAGLPSWRLVDAEQAVDAVCLVARVECDWEEEATAMELWG